MKIKMSNTKALVIVLVVAGTFLLASCTNQKKDKEMVKEEVVIERDADGNITDFTVYAYDQKDDIVAAAQEDLDKMNQKIDELKAELNNESNKLSVEAKAQYEQTIADLEKARDDYNVKVDALKDSSEDNWEQAKADVNKAYRDAESNVKKGWENFKEGLKDVAKDVKEGVDKAAKDVEKSLK